MTRKEVIKKFEELTAEIKENMLLVRELSPELVRLAGEIAERKIALTEFTFSGMAQTAFVSISRLKMKDVGEMRKELIGLAESSIRQISELAEAEKRMEELDSKHTSLMIKGNKLKDRGFDLAGLDVTD